ncbi:MAG: hypothetical protein EA378_09300 [Phycisphaerales bacterium]|nr:MAG: hypothetical protein EA378_09300 [Phycisphaerales bacterium]
MTRYIRLVVPLWFAVCVMLVPFARGDDSPAGESRDYVFVFITSGPVTPTREQAQEAMQGHFANMERLAEVGKLLIAGPLVDPRSDPKHRGIFVFDETDVGEGLKLAETDPAAEMGVFTMTAHRFTTDRPLTDLPRLEKEDEARRLADPDVPDAWEGRRYYFASAPWDEAAGGAASRAAGVPIAGRLHGAGADGTDLLLIWLDAEAEAAAREMLPEGPAWTVHGWYGSKMVAEMGA